MPPPPTSGFQPGPVLQTALQGCGEYQNEELLTTLSTCHVGDVDLVTQVQYGGASATATSPGKSNWAVRNTALSPNRSLAHHMCLH